MRQKKETVFCSIREKEVLLTTEDTGTLDRENGRKRKYNIIFCEPGCDKWGNCPYTKRTPIDI